jgi:flagellar biosynthesis protein FlhF
MHLKRYRRSTVPEALIAVRDELGPDAYVLSTRTVAASGVRGWLGRREVEVTAAAERLPVSETRQPASQAAHADAIVARLEASGLDGALSRRVADTVPSARRRGLSVEALHAALAGQLTESTVADDEFEPVEVFVGPPGAGKTTTIAKIAAQERARRGKKLSLLSADGFRVGAVEQLRIFADIIGAPFMVARSPEELVDTLDRGRRPLLLDTAGRSPNDDASREMFRVLSRRKDVRTHLVLPAATVPGHARRAIERFHDARPSRLVLTKCDESESIAPLLTVARDVGLPVSFLGTGQSVPEDLHRATPALLASWVLGEPAGMGACA